jgi:hypothetical protein
MMTEEDWEGKRSTVFARERASLFGQEFTLQNWDAANTRDIASFFTIEPATPVLYVVKFPVEPASV